MISLSNRNLILAIFILISLACIQNFNGNEYSRIGPGRISALSENKQSFFTEVSASTNVKLNSTGKSYSIAQLADASAQVRNIVELNRSLPDFIIIAGDRVVLSDFLYLLSRAVVNLDRGNTSSLVHYRVGAPSYSLDEVRSGNILRGEYVVLAGDVNSVVESTGRAPYSISSSQGSIAYESQIYLFSRIIAFYGSQGRLPNFAGISPWTGTKLPNPPSSLASGEPTAQEPSKEPVTKESSGLPFAETQTSSTAVKLVSVGKSYSIAQLSDAGVRVRDFVKSYNRLPAQVTIAGDRVVLSDFLYLLSRAVVNLDRGNTSSLVHYRVGAPSYSLDEVRSGNILRGEYVVLAGDVNSVVESTGRAPPYINSEWGYIAYESQIYLFSRIIAFYGSQKRLPNQAAISPWTGTKLRDPPAGEPAVTPTRVLRIINNATGGDLTLNTYIKQYIPHTQLTQEVINAARKGTPMVSFGKGYPQVLIVAGVHGNEIPATIAAMKLINYLDGKTLIGTVHVIPFAIPYSTSINSRLWQGQDPNRVANIVGTPTNIILNKAKELKVVGMGDFHSTQPGGVPGRTSIICTQIPTYESYILASFISKQTGSELINHYTAGVVYPGGLEDEGSKSGIPSIIAEVMSPHAYADPDTINTSYQQMIAFLNYFKII